MGNLIAGGAIDYSRITSTNQPTKWRLAFARISEDGENPSNGDPVHFFNYSDEEDDEDDSDNLKDKTPLIDQLHLDDTSTPGEEWLIGSARSYDLSKAGEYSYVFKVKLDANHVPSADGLACK